MYSMSQINPGLFTSNSDDYGTPQKLFDELNAEFNFDVDVCASAENAKCPRYFSKAEDGLSQNWSDFRMCYMNPPYGRQIGIWVQKAYETSLKGSTVVCLLPARTDTKWFHDYCLKGEIRFLRGRLKFNDGKNPAPFPSMIVIFRSKDN